MAWDASGALLALVTTDSDDRAIAVAAMIGDRLMPKNG